MHTGRKRGKIMFTVLGGLGLIVGSIGGILGVAYGVVKATEAVNHAIQGK